MSLIHSSLGWGMLLGTIPIIIYIIFRRRFRIVRWAAMELLLAAIRRRYRHVRLQDFILLALRTLALVAAALAVARPVLSRSQSGPGKGGRGSTTDAVIILDTSYSMSMSIGAENRLDSAKRRAQAIVSALPQASRVCVSYMTDKVVPVTEGVTADTARVRMAIEAARATAEGTDALAALTSAVNTLKSSKAPDRRVFIVTDGQARMFESSIDKLRQTIAATDESIRFTVVTTAEGAPVNLMVSNLDVTSRWLRPGVPVEFTAIVEDPGTTPPREPHAEFWVDGRKVDRSPVTLAGHKGKVTFRYTFGSAGVHGIEVRLDTDALDVDNHRYVAVCVPASTDMLVVVADKATPTDGAGVFIDAAMTGANETGQDVPGLPWVVRPQIGRDRLASELDPAVWCVVLADPGPLSSDALDRLDEFVREGGSILLGCGAESTATLGSLRSGRGAGANWLSDLTLEPAATQPAGEKGYRQLRPESPTTTILDLGSPGVRKSISDVHVFQSIAAAPARQSRWATAMEFTDGRSALLVLEPDRTRRGRLALWTSSLDSAWCDLPYRPAFVTLFQDLTAWLSRPRLVAGSLTPGTTWHPSIPGAVGRLRSAAATWRIAEPDGNRVEASSFVDSGDAKTSALSFDRTHRPGVYRLAPDSAAAKEAGTALQAVAINVDTRESDLTVWSEAQLRDLFPPGRLDMIRPNEPIDAVVRVGSPGREIWPAVATCLGVLLLVETVLAYRFSYQKSAATSPVNPRPSPNPEGVAA